MKQKMKRSMSIVALVVMLISLFSVFVVPATAEGDNYSVLLAEAYVVNPTWEGKVDGDAISFVFQGKTVATKFDKKTCFTNFDNAYAQAQKDGVKNPVILLTAGTYTETINIKGAVRLLGANAGIDPNEKSSAANIAWTNKRSDLSKETVIRCTIDVNAKTGAKDLVLDGLTFANGGAFADHHRNVGASEITIKNSVFDGAGNATTNYYAIYLRSANHSRTLRLQNLYITGQNNEGIVDGMFVGFVCPYFTKLYADNIAYVENKVGFLASTWFAVGVSPVIEVTNSCFYNANAATPNGHVISMDNNATDYNQVINTDVSQRPNATLKVAGNVFYNASAASSATNPNVKGGVIHFQFVNTGSVYNIKENYFYGQDGTSFMDSEFLVNASSLDMSSCMSVRNNRFIGTYKAPSLVDSYYLTYIDISQNYFARVGGDIVTSVAYMAESDQRAIRTSFWVDEEMTKLNTDWDIATSDWSLAWVDNSNYNVDIFAYTDGGKNVELPIKFKAQRDGLKVQLYKSATLDSSGAPVSVKDPISSINTKSLNSNPYEPTVLYLQVTDPKYPQFTPIYTLTISNCGDVKDMLNFSKELPEYLMYHPTASKLKKGEIVPYKWRNHIYLMEVGKNLFASVSEAVSYGYSKGYENPTVCIPAGTYFEELVIPGSCTILGEQYGINPNVKPYEYLTQDKFESSAWTLNPMRADMKRETVFNACIRVAEGADDYVITIDGIVMGNGCSYVDDCARNSDNVTILKNILALNAGGGLDRNGARNTQLFNFNKAFGALSDRCTFYLYDSRIDGLKGIHFFGPYYEKLVLDGNYFGNATGGSILINAMQSRDIADPYYAMTNCYLHNNNGDGQEKIYMINTNDAAGELDLKTNIIYNFDGNVMNYGFQSDNASFKMTFTPSMTFYFTNNTYRSEKDVKGLWLSDKASSFHTSCAQENCSEIIVFKGNRLIESTKVPGTQGTGYGTMLDYSGNYWSATVDGTGQLPGEMNVVKVAETPLGSYTYEECTRYKVDYNYLDWDMTIRSDEVLNAKSYLNLSKGMFNTGSVTTEIVDGKKMQVLHDKVPANVLTYDFPASASEFDTIKYFTDAACSNQVLELQLTKSVNEFYGMVYPYGYSEENTEGTIPFKVIIERSKGTEAKLLAVQGGLVDQKAKTVTYELANTQNILDTKKIGFEVSAGASYGLYTNKNCTTSAASVYFTNIGSPIPTLYLKVVSEDGKVSTVYTVNVKAITPGSCATAAISNIIGMTDMGGDVYYAEVPVGASSVTFTPVAYFGSKIVVRNGSKLISAASDGSYTFDMGDAKTAELKLTATSQNGANSKVYTLKFKVVASNEAKLYGIENAVLTSTGYSMAIGLSKVVENIKADVTAGATYKLYNDYECTSPVAAGPIILSDSTKVVYVKVTSANGANSTVTRLTIHSSVKYKTGVEFVGTIGKTEYKANQINKTDFNLYLPASTKTVALKSVFDKVENGVKVKFYADPYRKIEIDTSKIQLNQKCTAIYFTIPDVNYKLDVSEIPGLMPVSKTAQLKGESGVINIISDRASVTYSDANKIATWVKPYVDYMNNNKFGIFEGDQNKKLNGDANITRNEIATVATRVMGLDVSKYSGVELKFADSVDEWAKPYVKAAVGAGMINGDLDTATGKTYFRGSNNATREQVIKILVCICMAKDGIVEDAAKYYTAHKNSVDLIYNTYKFEDEATVSSWAAPYMHMAVGKYQMVNGSLYNNKLYLYPKNNITRAEVAKMVACYLGY
mgnify:CR=1 FL=1